MAQTPQDRQAGGANAPVVDGKTPPRGIESDASDDAEDTIEDALASRVVKLESELADTRERLMRVAADFDNYRKRNEREKIEFLKFANERVLKEILPIADNLGRAVDTGRRLANPASIVVGLEMLLNELLKVLKKFGVEPVESVGRQFDPAFHEALQQVETQESEPGVIMAEVQRGYTLHGRVLRPALVVVARAPSQAAPAPANQGGNGNANQAG